MIINYLKLNEMLENCDVDGSKYIMKKAKNGENTLKIMNDNSYYFLHCEENPNKEGDDFAISHMEENVSDYVVYGLGLGYHISAMANMMNSFQNLFIFESDINIVKLAFENTDIKKLFQNENVFFYFIEDISVLINSFSNIVTSLNAKYIFQEKSIINLPFFISNIEECIKTKEEDIKCIVIFIGISGYDALEAFANQISIGFKALGYKIITFDFNNGVIEPDNYDQYRNNVKFAISFNGLALKYIRNNQQYVFDDIGIKNLISIFVDHPIHQTIRVKTNYEYSAYTWIDKERLEYAKKYYPHAKHSFLPHGGDLNIYDDDLFTRDRQFEVIFSGSAPLNCTPESFLLSEPEEERQVLELLVHKSLKSSDVDFVTICEQFFDKYTEKNSNQYLDFLTYFGQKLDKFLRRYSRYSIIKSILDSGINLHCFGSSWEKTDFINYPNFHNEGAVNYTNQRKIFKNSKIVLNQMPGIRNGSHERVFSSMLTGALCVTNPSIYLKESFIEKKEIIFFNIDELNNLPELINYYIKNDNERISITKAAYKKAQENHTWFERAQEIIKLNDDLNSYTNTNSGSKT